MKYIIKFTNFLIFSCRGLGSFIIKLLYEIGIFSLFLKNVLSSIFGRPFFLKNFINSFLVFGLYSIPVVSLTAIFTGAVLALQLHYGFEKFNVTEIIPIVVLISLTKELGPVLCGLMISARVGSSMTAEIAGMAVNNHIDSLITLSANPFRFLILPRVLSTIIAMPILTTIVSIIGVLGAFLVSVYMFDFSIFSYLQITLDNFIFYDYWTGIVKSLVFGAFISIIACYNGYYTSDGAVGIGRATIKTVVTCCVGILFFNFIIAIIMS